MPQDPFDDIVRGYDQQFAPPKVKPVKPAKPPSFDDLIKDVDGQAGSAPTRREQRRQNITALQDELTATTPQVKPGNTLNVATGRQYPTPPPAPFQSPIDMRLNAPNEAQKAFDRAAAAVQPIPITPAPRPKQTLGQIKQQARSAQPVTQEDISRNPVTSEERKAATELFIARNERDKKRQQAAAKAKLEEEASRASQSTLGKMGTRFARGAVRGTTQTPFEFVQMVNPDPVVRQTMGRIADDSKEWQSQNLPVDNRNPATLNVFKPEFYSLENVGKAATENIPEVLGEMLPQMALARGAGGVARLAAPELAAATVPRMASTTGAQLAARAAAGGYGAAQQSTQAYQKALDAGMTPEQAARAAAIEAPIGFSEFLGSPGTTGFTRPGTTIRREMREEGLQELGQTAASGLAGKYASGYDANKPLVDIAGESIGSGILGGVTGGIVATPGARLQARQQADQQRATRSAIDQRSAANAAAIAPQPAAAQPVTEPLTEPMAAQPQPSAPASPQAQPQGFPRLPEPEGFNARRAKLLGMPTPAEVGINEQVQAAAQLLDSTNEGDQRQGRRMLNKALTDLRKAEGYLAEAALPPDAPRPFTAVRDAIEARLKPAPKVKEAPANQVPSSSAVETAQPTASNALRAEADAAKIKAAEFEQVGDFTQAAATYQAAHQNLKRLRRSMGQPKTPEAVAQINQIDREISIADANRRKANQAARTAQRQANALTAGLPENPQSAIRNPQSTEAPLLRPDAVQNPEGGIPQMPEPTFTDRLEAATRRDASARGKAKPAKRLLSRIAELGGISDRYAGELQDVKDARRVGVIRDRATMSPDVLARQLQSEGYDVDPEDLNTLWEAARRDVAGRDERTSQTSELERRLAEEEAAYNERQPFDQIVADVDAEPTNRLRESDYEGGELQRYSKPLEGQEVEREAFQPDTADLREVREFGKREPRTEQFTEEPPTAPLVRRRAEPQELSQVTAMREREALPPIERREAKRQAVPKGMFGKLSESSYKGRPNALVENPQLRRLLGLGEMPEYRLPDAPINPKTGEPYVNPAWTAEAQNTLNALAELAGKERSSQVNFSEGAPHGVTGKPTRSEFGELFGAVTRLARRKGERIDPNLQLAFEETGTRARNAQAGWQEFTVDERTENIRQLLYDTFRQGKLDRATDKTLRDSFQSIATEYGLSDTQATNLYRQTREEARSRAERAGSEPSRGAATTPSVAERGERVSGNRGRGESATSGRAAEPVAAQSEVRQSATHEEKYGVTFYHGRFIGEEPPGALSFFTDDPHYASNYANAIPGNLRPGERPRVYPVKLEIKKPFIVKSNAHLDQLVYHGGAELERIKELGYDALVLPFDQEGRFQRLSRGEAKTFARTVVPLYDNQVRSLFERGESATSGRVAKPGQIKTGDSVTWKRGDKTESGVVTKIVGQYATVKTASGETVTRDKKLFTALEAQRPKIAERREAQPKTREDVENSPEFKRWFGDSVVTENGKPGGKPLVMYHGTANAGYDSFSTEKQDAKSLYGPGFYFTAATDIASEYGDKGAQYEIDASTPITKRVMSNAGRWFNSKEAEKLWNEDIGIREGIDKAQRAWEQGVEAFSRYLAGRDYRAEFLRDKLRLKRQRTDRAGVYPVYLSIKKPFDIEQVADPAEAMSFYRKTELSEDDLAYLERQYASRKITNQELYDDLVLATRDKRKINQILQDAGYDGIKHIGGKVWGGGSHKHQVYIAFSPNQIKSAIGNRGTFDPASAKITERRSEAMPERYTGRQLFENAQLTFRPARNRPATLVANDWGGAMLNQLLNDTFGITTTDANFTIGAKDAKDLRDYLAEAKDSGIYEPAQVANMDAMLKQMDAAIADAEANQQDVAFVTRRPAEPISATKAKIRHEAAHLSQSRIAADLSALTGKNWLDSQPNAKDIHKELDRRGYAPETHDYEAAAFVASGDYGVFGMNLDQAAKFLSDYFGAVVEKHGKRALQKFGAIDPKLQPTLEAARREIGTTRSSTDGRTNEAAQGTPRRIGAAGEARGSSAGVRTERRERRQEVAGSRPARRGVVLASGLGAFQNLFERDAQPKEAKPAPLPKDFDLARWSQKSYNDALVNALSSKDRAEYNRLKTAREKQAFLFSTKIDPDLEAKVFKLIDRAAEAYEKGDGADFQAVRDEVRSLLAGQVSPSLRDVKWYDHLQSRLSNVNFKGTYERIAGEQGKEISEIFRNAQVDAANGKITRAEAVTRLQRELKPYIRRLKSSGKPGLARWVENHIDAVSDPDQSFKGLAGFLRGFQYNTKLRLNPRSALINTLQPFQTLWPHLTTAEWLRIQKEAAKPSTWKRISDVAARESGGSVEEVNNEKRFLGWADLFSPVSEYNRIVGHLAGELFADRNGLTGDAKARMAADWAKKVEFDNSAYDIPPLFSGKIAGVVGQFKPFMVKNLERLYTDWKSAPPEALATNKWSGAGTIARRSKMVLAQFLIGGVRAGIPGLKHVGGVLVLGALAKAFGKFMDDDKAEKLAEAVYFGAPALVEQDLSGSVAIFDEPFGKTGYEKIVNFAGGPTLSLIAKAYEEGKNINDAEDSKTQTKSEKQQDAALRLAKAITPYTKWGIAGAAAMRGERPSLWLGKETPMTTAETVGYSLLGTPLRQSKYYEHKEAYDWQKNLMPDRFEKEDKKTGTRILPDGKIDAGMIRQKVGEPEAIYKQRVQRVEGWMSEYGDKLLSHPRYGTLTAAQQEAAIESLRRRIGTQQNATRPRLDSLTPEKIIQSVLKSEATRPKREAGKLWSPPANRP